MSLGSIGQNSAQEFFETIIYHTAYNEAHSQIGNLTKDMEDGVLKEAVEGSMNVLAMGAIFLLISKQEELIQSIFNKSKALVVLILGSQYANKVKQRLANTRGLGFLKKFDFFKSAQSDRIATASLVLQMTDNHLQAHKTAQNSQNTVGTTMQFKEHLINKERLNFEVGGAMAQRYNETLLFKLFTKSFTSKDEMMIKKILGRDTASGLNVDDMNKVADFLFVTDSNGKITGLSEQLFSLINGLGYVHNK